MLSLTDFWHRAQVSRPVLERLVLAGAFDSVYGIGSTLDVRRRGKVTRRDLLLQVAELDRHACAVDRAGRGRGLAGRRVSAAVRPADLTVGQAGERNSSDPLVRSGATPQEGYFVDGRPARDGVWARAAAQSRATRTPRPVDSVQLTLDLGDEPGDGEVSGLPEMDGEERMKAELEILGLDVSRHVVDTYAGFLDQLGITRSKDLLARRSRSELLVAGVKVATQTPPIRSGRRVIFLTLDDGTGPVDATFFEDAQGPYAATVFHSWLLVVRGELRRTGHRGVSLRATGCWALPELFALWQSTGGQAEGIAAVRDAMAVVPEGFATPGDPDAEGRRRVLVHSSGFQMSPYSDIKPAGEETKGGPRKPWVEEVAQQPSRNLWHRSPGSAG